jgi:alpha-L-rhamnosidase
MKKPGLFLILFQVLFSCHLIAKELDLSPAKWIWYPSDRTLQNTFILFRKEININKDQVIVKGWIVADSRYQLFVNGQLVQWGPAPFDPRWQEADPVDISSYLKSGKNVIACQVLFYGTGDGTSPLGIPGFLMKIDIGGKELITDSSWKSLLARCWNPGQYKRWYLRALQENFDARLYPSGWNTTDFTENIYI